MYGSAKVPEWSLKNKAIRLRWSDFKIYHKTALIKIMWSEPNAAHVDQRNKVKSTEKDPHINVHLIHDKGAIQ